APSGGRAMLRSPMRRCVLTSLLFACACATDLPLPPMPGQAPEPRIDHLETPVSILSAGSPVIVSGANLDQGDEVLVATVQVPKSRLTITPKALYFTLTDDLFPSPDDPHNLDAQGRSVEEQLEGRQLPVRVVAHGREYVTLETLRYFIG